MENTELINKFIQSLKAKTGLNAEVSGARINIFTVSKQGLIFQDDDEEQVEEMESIKEILFYIEIEEILALENECKAYYAFDDEPYSFEIGSDTYFEVAVELKRYPPFILQRALDEARVINNGYTLEITKLSSKYLYSILMHEKFDEEKLDGILRIRTYRLRDKDTTITNTFNDLTEMIILNTCKVFKDESNESKMSMKKYRSMVQSYLFNISYSLSIMIDFHKFKRNERYVSRKKRETQFFPYRKYNQNLIKYYYQAVNSDLPFVQYIAFYHIIEHFFFSVSEEEVFDRIKSLITSPSFVPKNKKSIKELYESLKKISRSQNENGAWKENEAFLLCLDKLIPDIIKLKDALQKLDTDYVERYKSNVDFIEETTEIDFDEERRDILFKKIRNRVYAVRNAIVHSKEGNESKYQPFIHDSHLAKEIPLIRALAEEIIINTSDEMYY
ncbi:hypothetical protein ACWG0P_05500 [Amedibacillus sp. YH-ame6]